jgi:hypothetical protein
MVSPVRSFLVRTLSPKHHRLSQRTRVAPGVGR